VIRAVYFLTNAPLPKYRDR